MDNDSVVTKMVHDLSKSWWQVRKCYLLDCSYQISYFIVKSYTNLKIGRFFEHLFTTSPEGCIKIQ
jgi:hypothetical protein